MNRDAWARQYLAAAWLKYGGPPSPAALQAAQAIAHMESGGTYGASDAQTSDAVWKGSNNWGAIKCASSGGPPCPAGCFEHKDSDGHGNVAIYCFRKYATPDDGAAAFLHELMRRPAVKASIASRNAVQIAEAMAQPPAYMTLPPPAYARLIAKFAETVAQNLGEPVYVTLGGASSTAGSDDLLIFLGLSWLGWELAKRYGKRRRN